MSPLVQRWISGVWSTLPAGLLARTRNSCSPCGMSSYVCGELHGVNTVVSSAHSKLANGLGELNVNVSVVLPVSSGGRPAVESAVSGAGSIVHVNVGRRRVGLERRVDRAHAQRVRAVLEAVVLERRLALLVRLAVERALERREVGRVAVAVARLEAEQVHGVRAARGGRRRRRREDRVERRRIGLREDRPLVARRRLVDDRLAVERREAAHRADLELVLLAATPGRRRPAARP